MDYEALGLKVGLEIHQQLDTHKLFCNCKSELNDSDSKEFVRLLRPSQSEMGEVDAAALSEAKKELKFIYEAPPSVCLVEADEEPPHEVNSEALDITLKFASMVDAKPVDEIHFMRKIVIDGSNTAGFQRTALVSLGGKMNLGNLADEGLKSIGISTISLEEDAARKIRETDSEIVYRLDRLGIPLIEIATEPDIKTPSQAKNVALRIGSLLRSTKQVKRGIGTIREDLNISISQGARVEIKGVQEPKMISVYVEEEVIRQLLLVEAEKTIEKRGIDSNDFTETKDLSPIFQDTQSKILAKWILKGGVVYGIKLKGFAGLFGTQLTSNIGISAVNDYTKNERRVLGPEFADYLTPIGIKGLFHSDELPGYGISDENVKAVKEAINVNEEDGFVLVAEMEDKAKKACEVIRNRAIMAFNGVPKETRDPQPDGTTKYSRPLPGKARMYPETDVPPIRITQEKMDLIKSDLPELPEDKEKKYVEDYGISIDQAKQILLTECEELFEDLQDKHQDKNILKIIARILLNTIPELEAEGVDLSAIDEKILDSILVALKKQKFAKEGISEILRYILEKDVTIDEAISGLGLGILKPEDLEGIIDSILSEKSDLIKEKGMDAVGPLMGLVMKELRGKVDGKLVNETLRRKVRELIE
jgi:glutamyl-tRNA(Gln) amidotransferase subunit E